MRRSLDLTLRLLGSQRTMSAFAKDAYTVRSALRIDWYIISDLMLDVELGYEWLLQDFADDELEVRQGFMMLGLRKRF